MVCISSQVAAINNCQNNTMMDYALSDPDLSLTAAWARNAKTDMVLSSPAVNVTMFMPTNEAILEGVPKYVGPVQIDASNVGQGDQAEAAVYNVFEGKYSAESFLALGSVNTILGMLKSQDFLVKMYKDDSGQLLAQGLATNNVAPILQVYEACNGVAYKVGKALLPANSDSQIYSRYGDGAIVAQIYANGSACFTTPNQLFAEDPQTTDWVNIWNTTGMAAPISNNLLAATIFVPQNEGVAASGAGANSSNAVMYNMLQGEFCPDELMARGSMNSMLGDVAGQEYPLKFTNDSGTLVISGEFGSARVISKSIMCHSVVLITDVPLLPPAGASAVPVPATLPTPETRHVSCNPVVYLNDGGGDSPQPDSGDSSNVGLAVGLGVGLGCAALLAAAGAFVYMRSRKRETQNSYPDLDGKPGDDMQRFSADGAILNFNTTGSNGTRSSSFGTVPASALFTSLVASPDGFHHTAKVAPTFFAVEADKEEFPGAGITPQLSRAFSGGGSSQLTRLASTESSLDLWEIDANDVEINVDDKGKPIELGRGSFGAVYRGTLRGVQPAAIKVLNASVGSDAEAAFQREAAILKHVNRDRNVVQLYGTSKMPDGKLLLVTELMDGGDLRRALNNPTTTETLQWHHNGKRVALDIARGLTALHAVHVVHRDLKSKNVLLTDNLAAKIADVGIAAVHSQGYLTASAGQVVGTLAWSAPELLLGQRCTEKVDIYSYGIVLWEIATGNVPVRGFTQPPPPSERCPEELAALINDCTHADPKQRPSAKEVYDKILLIPPVVTA